MKPYSTTPLHLTCPHCGTRHTRCASWRWGDYCTRECYLAQPFPRYPHISVADIERVRRMYPTQKAAAAALGVGYKQYRRYAARKEQRPVRIVEWRG